MAGFWTKFQDLGFTGPLAHGSKAKGRGPTTGLNPNNFGIGLASFPFNFVPIWQCWRVANLISPRNSWPQAPILKFFLNSFFNPGKVHFGVTALTAFSILGSIVPVFHFQALVCQP